MYVSNFVNVRSAFLQLPKEDRQGEGNFATFHSECAPEEPFLQRSGLQDREKGFEDYGRVVCYAL
jgi:hypothetical protein